MFFFSDNAASACDLHFILMNALEALTSIKLKPTAIVCDQGSTNRLLYRVMGITVDQPFLYVSAHCMLPYTCTCHSTGLLSLLYIIIIIMSFELTCPVKNVVSYVGGYINRKLKLNDSCSGCLALLTDKSSSVTEENLFIHFKDHRHNDNSAFGSGCNLNQCAIKNLKYLQTAQMRIFAEIHHGVLLEMSAPLLL